MLDEIIGEANEEPKITGTNEEAEAEDEPHSEQEDVDGSDEDELIGPDDLEEAIQFKTTTKDDTMQDDNMKDVTTKDGTPDAPCFFFDLKGDQSQEKMGKPVIDIPERPSSRSSTSSEEVILFRGRSAPRKPEPQSNIDMVQMQAEIRVVEQALAVESTPLASSPAPELPTEPVRNSKPTKKERKQKQRDKRKTIDRVKEEEDAILADYIANLKENADVDEYFKELIQGGIESDGSEMSESSSTEADAQQKPTSTRAYITDGDESGEESEQDHEAANGDDIPSEIDDETLARLIAGHELGFDLGMEDVNFGDSLSDSDSDSDEPTKETKQRQMLVDDFDMMDWDRPSLRPRKKGKGARAQINFNLSDSELEATLQASWKSDRLKKSERKRQREEMRALGMLGKKANPDDLRIKYPDGMNMDQVGDEMRTFMINGDEQ